MLLYFNQYFHTSDQFYQKLHPDCFKAAVFASDSNWHALQQPRFPSYPSLEASRITSTTITDKWIRTNHICNLDPRLLPCLPCRQGMQPRTQLFFARRFSYNRSALDPMCDAEKDWHEHPFRASGEINNQ